MIPKPQLMQTDCEVADTVLDQVPTLQLTQVETDSHEPSVQVALHDVAPAAEYPVLQF